MWCVEYGSPPNLSVTVDCDRQNWWDHSKVIHGTSFHTVGIWVVEMWMGYENMYTYYFVRSLVNACSHTRCFWYTEGGHFVPLLLIQTISGQLVKTTFSSDHTSRLRWVTVASHHSLSWVFVHSILKTIPC